MPWTPCCVIQVQFKVALLPKQVWNKMFNKERSTRVWIIHMLLLIGNTSDTPTTREKTYLKACRSAFHTFQRNISMHQVTCEAAGFTGSRLDLLHSLIQIAPAVEMVQPNLYQWAHFYHRMIYSSGSHSQLVQPQGPDLSLVISSRSTQHHTCVWPCR